MRKKILLIVFGVLFIASSALAQVCGTYEGSLEEKIKKYPHFYQSLEAKDAEIKLAHQKALENMTHQKTGEGKKIIPVVVHVIHNGGSENLSMAQIQNGLDHLNDNINGQAYNFLSVTPDIFAAVRGDLNVEFRLAKIDPNGNPTSGVVRVQSELTVATVTETLSRDRVKTLSYWNSFQYFNIWVVQSMPAGPDPSTDPALNGYAQFPYPNPTFGNNMSTDGVMIRAAVFAAGETITHEVGHWLGLCHTWDCGGGTCGTDNVADTPIDREGTFDFNGTFPFHAGLSNPSGAPGVWGCLVDSLNPAGEMYMNYMDYQADAYQSMFTKGQDEVMNEVLDGVYDAVEDTTGIGYREYMWSAENIAATGVSDGFVPPFCTQEADFSSTAGVSSMCEGEQIIVKGNQSAFGAGNITSFIWDFGDGITDNSGNNFLSHTYSSANSYDVTLTVEYNELIESKAADLADLDIVGASSYDSIVESLIVQGTEQELNDLGASNITLHLDIDSLSLNSKWKYNAPEDSVVGAHSSFLLGLDTFLLVFTAEYGDSLSLEEYDRLDGCFLTWQQDSIGWQGDTLTYYYGNYESIAYDAYFMDTLFYRGNLDKKTYVAYYNNSCVSSITKEDFITVHPSSSSSNASSYAYSFESEYDWDGGDWQTNQSIDSGNQWNFNNTNNTAWEWVDYAAVDGTASIKIEGENMLVGRSAVIISKAYDLSAFTTPAIRFSWSGASVNTFPVNELAVTYSDNCGETWKALSTIGAVETSNAGLYTTNFKPNASEWDTIVMTASQLKDSNIRFKIEYIVNGTANNFYLDNIMIGEESSLMIAENNASSRIAMFPNPAKGYATIALENIADQNVEVTLINILGEEVHRLYSGRVISMYQEIPVNLTSFEKGIYFVKVSTHGDIVLTDKLIIE